MTLTSKCSLWYRVPLLSSSGLPSLFWTILLRSLPYCSHIHVLLKLALFSVFRLLQTVLPVFCSTMQSPRPAPVTSDGQPVVLSRVVGASPCSALDWSLLMSWGLHYWLLGGLPRRELWSSGMIPTLLVPLSLVEVIPPPDMCSQVKDGTLIWSFTST